MLLLPTPPGGVRLIGALTAFGGVGAGLVLASGVTLGRCLLEKGDPRALAAAERALVPGLWVLALIVCGIFFAQFAKKHGASDQRTGLAALLGAGFTLLCAAAPLLVPQLAA